MRGVPASAIALWQSASVPEAPEWIREERVLLLALLHALLPLQVA
jgi:hypothetical protein